MLDKDTDSVLQAEFILITFALLNLDFMKEGKISKLEKLVFKLSPKKNSGLFERRTILENKENFPSKHFTIFVIFKFTKFVGILAEKVCPKEKT